MRPDDEEMGGTGEGEKRANEVDGATGRRFDLAELEALLEAHARWVETGGREGEEADLRGADLSKAVLRGANLSGSDLERANLAGADLSGADLSGARLPEADLRDANLVGANLSAADLSRTNGLAASQFRKANLHQARLPAYVGELPVRRRLDHLSRSVDRALIAMITACVFTWLAARGATDADLFSNARLLVLPVLGTSVPVPSFYLLSPILLLVLMAHLHAQIHRLVAAFRELPARWVDGSSALEAMPTGLAQVPPEYSSTDEDVPWQLLIAPSAQFVFFTAVAWLLTPMTIGFLWLRYLVRHDPLGTFVQMIALVAAVGVAVFSYQALDGSLRLRRGTRDDPEVRRTWRRAVWRWLSDLFIVRHWRGILATIIWAPPLLFVSALPYYGVRYGPSMVPVDLKTETMASGDELPDKTDVGSEEFTPADPRIWVPLFLESFGFSPFADLRGVAQGGIAAGAADAGLRSRDLEGRDLRFADGRWVDLPGVSFAAADLQGSNFYRADLNGSSFGTLTRRYLPGPSMLAHTFGQIFRGVLSGESRSFPSPVVIPEIEIYQRLGAHDEQAEILAELARDFASGFALDGADLRKARLILANLEEARLDGARLDGADLRGAILKDASLRVARAPGANLSGADLRGADLRFADLKNAVLSCAQLDGARLDGARLVDIEIDRASCRTLEQATGLTAEQLSVACVRDYGAEPEATGRKREDGDRVPEAQRELQTAQLCRRAWSGRPD